MSVDRRRLTIYGGDDALLRELSSVLADRFELSAGTDRREGNGAPALAPAGPDAGGLLLAVILDEIPHAIAVVTPAGDPAWRNAAFARLDADMRARIVDAARAAAGRTEPDDPPPAELTDPASGAAHRVSLRVLGHGPGRRVLVMAQDVTAAARLRQKMDALDRAGLELVRLEPDAVRRMNSVERLRLLESKITRSAHDLLSFDHFAIRLVEERTGKLELVMSSGMPPEIGDFTLYARAEGNGISGYVAATGQTYVCDDTASDPLFLPGLGGARSSLTVPLVLHEKVLGIMDIERADPRAFTDDDRRFAEAFARYVTMALHMLDVLVVERSTVNQAMCGSLERELAEPLDDIAHEVDVLRPGSPDESTRAHLERIRGDVDSIRRRVREVAAGPQSLLGVEAAVAKGSVKDPRLVGKRILVADDEGRIRLIIHDFLTARGATVVACSCGREAIERLEKAASGAEPPFDLVLSDIKMPDRNGYEVFSAARKSRADLPVILMTGFGYDPHHSIVRASQDGLQSVLFKPFQLERLVDEVGKALAPRA